MGIKAIIDCLSHVNQVGVKAFSAARRRSNRWVSRRDIFDCLQQINQVGIKGTLYCLPQVSQVGIKAASGQSDGRHDHPRLLH